MNNTNSKFSEDDLQAYVDGNLSETRHEEIREYLEQHPAELNRINEFKEQNSLLHSLYDNTDEKLQRRVMVNNNKAQSGNSIFLIPKSYAASLVWLIIGIMLGIGINSRVTPESTIAFTLPQNAMTAHVVFSPEVRHPVEVTAAQEIHLVKWLSKRLNRKLTIPNLNPIGYDLVGGRLLSAQVGPAAQFMYENKSGNRLTLYVIEKPSEDTAFQFFEKNNIKVFSWNDTNMGFAIVGNISKKGLLDAANKVYSEIII